MIQQKEKSFALFSSYRMSLRQGQAAGFFWRERDILRAWLGNFQKIYLLTYGKKDEQLQKFLPKGAVILAKKSRLPDWLYSIGLVFYYRKQLARVNFFRTEQMLGSWSGVMAKWLYQKPLVVRTGYTESRFAKAEQKSLWKRAVIDLIERLAYGNADQAIVASEQDRQYLLKKYRHIAPIAVVPNAINTEIFKPDKPRSREDRSLGGLRFLFVGRLIEQKNVLNLLEAFAGLKNAYLTIIGTGPLSENIKDKILELKIKDKTELIDNIPNHELPRHYNNADLYIQPSLYEGNPKTILEAMSCGLPVIAARAEGVASVVEHLKNGYLCGTDPVSIRNAMRFLQRDRALRATLGRNAREFIEQNYALERVISKELALYEKFKVI